MSTLVETRPLDLVADFPAIPAGWAYLDTAATAQKPRPVIEAIAAAYGETYATVHRGVYARSADMTIAFEEARSARILTPAQSLSLMIATGIGLHNFSEGLAIGQSAAAGEISLALVLIIGFGLHNATEGFGIVGPFAGSQHRPSWGFLLLAGLIGGGPTFFGTLIGQAWVSDALSVAFLALAAGSILYVVIELLDVCRRLGRKRLVAWGIVLGLTLGFATDFVLVAAGA